MKLNEKLMIMLNGAMQSFADVWQDRKTPTAKVLMAYGGAQLVLLACEGTEVEQSEDYKHAKMLLHDAECQMLDAGVI